MNNRRSKFPGREASHGRGEDPSPGAGTWERDELPSLPADCLPEPDSRSTQDPERPAEASERVLLDSGEPPAAEATGTRRRVLAGRAPRGTFESLLRSLIGRAVTVVDPESYEEAPVGHCIRAAFYRAKLIGMSEDYIIMSGEFVHRRARALNGRSTETIRHYVPIGKIKRISILANEPLIHV